MNKRDFSWDGRYCYPNSYVLVNYLNIRDEVMLNEAEANLSSLRRMELTKKPVQGNLDFNHLKEIHRYLFQDLYPWAGQVRTVSISKGNVFCLPQNIPSFADGIFNELRDEHYLIKTPRNEIVERLSYYLGELNALHPFREGNGRTQRMFLRYMANVAGYDLDFSGVTQADMIQASADSFRGDQYLMNAMIMRAVRPTTRIAQKRAIGAIFSEGAPKAALTKHVTATRDLSR